MGWKIWNKLQQWRLQFLPALSCSRSAEWFDCQSWEFRDVQDTANGDLCWAYLCLMKRETARSWYWLQRKCSNYFFCRLTNLKCCHFFQFTLGRITLRLSSREAEDSSCILPVNHVYRRQSTCRGLSCSLPMSGSYLHILCSAADKEDFYIKRERFPPVVVQVTVAKCVISLPSVPLVHSDRYLATCLQTPASRRSALLLELDLCKWLRWAVLLRACIFGSQRACLHEGKLNYHLRSCRIDDELGWLKSRSELWPVRSDSDMCFFLRILVGAASKIIMCNCCEHPAEGLGTAGSKQGQLLEDTGEAKFWELRLNISCCVLIAVLKTPQLLLT